jgi:hypothetical protein
MAKAMSEHGETVCIECGVYTERLLPERFPHICARCLFEVVREEPDMEDVPVERMPMSLLERIESRNLASGWWGVDSTQRPGSSVHRKGYPGKDRG